MSDAAPVADPAATAPAPASPTPSAPAVAAAPAAAAPATPAPAADPAKPADPAAVVADPAKPADPAAKPADPAAKPEGPPESYADFVAPEGTALLPEVATAYKEAAKDLGLTQEGAQKLLDKVMPKVAAQNKANLEAQVKDTVAKWDTAARADKELLEGNFDENIATAALAVEKYGDAEFAKFLKDSGMGSHPSMVRMMFRVGKTLKQDGVHVQGGNKGAIPANDARSLYPNSNHN